MRTGVEGWLVILAVAGIAAYVILTRRLEHRQFMAEGSELGIDRMVQRPSDDDLGQRVNER
jgi:hypothetical protein